MIKKPPKKSHLNFPANFTTMIIVKNFGAKIWLFAMFWYETLSGFQHAVSSNAHNMNYGLLMTNVPLLHMMQEGFFDFQKKTQHFFSGSYWRCHRSHWHQSELFWKCHTLSKLVGHCEFTHWLTSRPLKMKGKSLIKGKYTAFYKKNQIVWKSPKKSH